MLSQRHSFVLAAALLLPWACLPAQSPVNLSGHWEGAIQIPDHEVQLAIDFASRAKGGFTGAISIPTQNLRSLPLQQVELAGQTVNFRAREDQPFTGVLSGDGKSISGTLSVSGHSIPVSITRTGEPKIAPAPKSPRIAKDLEGTWNGTLEGEGARLRLVLTMSNQPDGTSIGAIVNLDEGRLEIPVTITRSVASLTLDLQSTGGSYSATLNPEATELSGTFHQGPLEVPLKFRRVAP